MTSIPSQLGQCKGSKIMTMSDSIRLNLYLNRFLDQKQHVQNIAAELYDGVACSQAEE
jgi:hypothetical protein